MMIACSSGLKAVLKMILFPGGPSSRDSSTIKIKAIKTFCNLMTIRREDGNIGAQILNNSDLSMSQGAGSQFNGFFDHLIDIG